MAIKNFFLNIARGAGIGVAMIIPGVSGGTVAVLLNIYDKIIDAINSGAGTIEEIQEATGAGTVCGGCISDIEELLKNRE